MSYARKFHAGDRSQISKRTLEFAIKEWRHFKKTKVKRQYDGKKPGPALTPVLAYVKGPASKLLAELDAQRKNISTKTKLEA